MKLHPKIKRTPRGGYRLQVQVDPAHAVLDEAAGTFNGLPLLPAESLTLSQAGADFIRKHEGHRRDEDGRHRLYDDDGGGHCTIGYGHLVHPGLCNGGTLETPYLDGLDEAAAQKLLEEDIRARVPELRSFIAGARVTQPMFDAMLSIHFNVGANDRWQLFAKVKEGHYAQAARQFDVVTANGVPVEGLANRRRFEIKLFLFGRY